MTTEAREQADSNSVYDDLRSLTVDEKLQIAAWFYGSKVETPLEVSFGFAAGLRHAIEIVREDGWRHLAPVWVTRWRARNERREPPSPPPSAWDDEVLKP